MQLHSHIQKVRPIVLAAVAVIVLTVPAYSNDPANSGSWTSIPTEGTAPSARWSACTMVDPIRDRIIMFGGWSGGDMNDTWMLSLADPPTWTQLFPTSTVPPARENGAAIYDPIRDRMLIFGGQCGSQNLDDVWELSLTGSPTWTRINADGVPPRARAGASVVYDSIGDRMIVFGGGVTGCCYLNDAWALSLSGTPTWEALTPAGASPPVRAGAGSIYDPLRQRLIIFGGGYGSALNDTWSLALSGIPTWTQLAPAGGPPAAREGYDIAMYDSIRDRMIIFGGYMNDDRMNDVWELTLDVGTSWTQLLPAGTPPPPPGPSNSMVYDQTRDRMIVFGGDHPMNELSVLSWGGEPTATVTFDFTPNTLNLASHGLWVTGYIEPTAPFAASDIDISSIQLNGTVPVAPEAPTSIGDYNANDIPDLMVKFSRTAVELAVSQGDDVPVTVTGKVDGHTFSATDYIRVRRAIVSAPGADSHLTSGAVTQVRWQTPSGMTVESVALLQSLDGGSTWSLVARAQPCSGSYDWTVPEVQTDQAKIAVVLVESADDTGYLVDGVLGVSDEFLITATTGVGTLPEYGKLVLGQNQPNPFNPRTTIAFSVPQAGRATLAIYDVRGTRVATLIDADLSAGVQRAEWDGTNSDGIAVPSGTYFARLWTAAGVRTVKVTLAK